MRNLVFLIISCSMTIACNKVKSSDHTTKENVSKSPAVENKENNTDLTEGIYFTANGTEPFWKLKITDERITLITPEQTFVTPHTEPIKAADANVKSYKIHTESTELNIQIKHVECLNQASDKQSNYTVDIELKKGLDKDLTILKGCGDYITDYRLHDIWILEELNGKTIDRSDFKNEFPRIEINTKTNQFIGFTGCNQMNGSLFFEKGLLRFSQIMTTKMMCESGSKETEFLKALQSTTTYTIADNRLVLSNSDGSPLVFKKID
ncbi:META domain-containing protein [Flavobacterium sediminis]|nr:META domain-containing protein [Flavobacterium sediminis]